MLQTWQRVYAASALLDGCLGSEAQSFWLWRKPPQTDQIMPACQSIDGAKNEFSKLIMQVKQTHRFAVLTLLIIVPPAYPQP